MSTITASGWLWLVMTSACFSRTVRIRLGQPRVFTDDAGAFSRPGRSSGRVMARLRAGWIMATIPNLVKLDINEPLPAGAVRRSARRIGLQQAVTLAQREADPGIQSLRVEAQFTAAGQFIGHALLDQRPAKPTLPGQLPVFHSGMAFTPV